MIKKVSLNGEVISGTPLEIISQMKESGIDFSGTSSIDEYMNWMPQNIFRTLGIGITVPAAAPPAEKAAVLVAELIRVGLLQEL